jgi:RNA polymerase sigma factor (sigma-70 family)
MATGQPNGVLQHLRRALLLRDGLGPTDRQLLADYVRGRDASALAVLVWRHGPMVWGVCRRLLVGYHDAEDAFQATFLVLVRKAASIAAPDLLANWLYGVAYQTARKARAVVAKRGARERQVTDMPEPAAAERDPWDHLRPLLDQELSRLSDGYRVVLVLCDLEGKTRKEAARQLGLPEGTVGSRLARARAALAKRLARRGVALSGGALAAVLVQNVASAGVPDAVVSSTISAAECFAAGQAAATGPVSAEVAALAEGVLKAMVVSKLKLVVAVLLVLCSLVAGITFFSGPLASAQDGQPPAVEAPVKAPERQVQKQQTRDQLKQIGSAMQGYFAVHQVYPGPALYGKDFKPLLSWRVALLPYLNEGNLHRQFHLDEPWDSAHNRQLLAKMPALFRGVGAKNDTATPFQVFVGKGTMFEGPQGLGWRHIPDGTANTIAVVEAAAPVPWTKPEDVPYSATGRIPELGGESPDVTYALFADGTVHALRRRFDSDALRIAIIRDDGIPTPFDKLLAPASEADAGAKTLPVQEKEGFTAWGKEIDGLQAGLGYRPGGKRAYSQGETVRIVARVRNVGKEAVDFKHIWAFFVENPPKIMDADDRLVQLPNYRTRAEGAHMPRSSNVAPGKEVQLYEWTFDLQPNGENSSRSFIHGTGKFNLQCERIVGPTSINPAHPNPAMSKLATGKLELEIKSDPPPETEKKAPQKQEKDPRTAWGKEVGGLQAGLGLRPGAQRAYHHGDTVTLVIRVRNVSKDEVKFSYLQPFIEHELAVTDATGKPLPQPVVLKEIGARIPGEVALAPGKEIEVRELKRELRPASESGNKTSSALYGTGKVRVQYEQVLGNPSMGAPRWKLDPVLSKLATGKLELDIQSEPLPAGQNPEKKSFTAWGKEVGGLQAGLDLRPAGQRAYRLGETVTLSVRVRNVGKETVKFNYIRQFLDENPPTITDADGNMVPQQRTAMLGFHSPTEVSLPPGKEIALESRLPLRYELRPASGVGKPTTKEQPLFVGTWKVSLQYERVFGNSSAGRMELDPTLGKLATGKVELEIESDLTAFFLGLFSSGGGGTAP